MEEDWQWIERFEKGDTEAFSLIFNKYKGLVLNLAYRFVGQREAAEDIAQDVLIKIYEKKVKVDPRAKFSTWLYRVTVNAALDAARKRKFFKFSLDERKETQGDSKETFAEALADPHPAPAPGEALADAEIKALVQKEIGRLPEKLRAPILLYQFQDIAYEEIAAILGISRKAVERRLYHAKEILRDKLSKLIP
ncbi:MAG: RNA polymerase sigma factor [Candidatus Omnitrophota bacterium]